MYYGRHGTFYLKIHLELQCKRSQIFKFLQEKSSSTFKIRLKEIENDNSEGLC